MLLNSFQQIPRANHIQTKEYSGLAKKIYFCICLCNMIAMLHWNFSNHNSNYSNNVKMFFVWIWNELKLLKPNP